MATPSRYNDGSAKGVGRHAGQNSPWNPQNVHSNDDAGAQGYSPSPLKTNSSRSRQMQRRYRSLFHQAAKEYQGWCQGEEDSRKALGSVCHLLDRLRMLEPGLHQDGDGMLGGLASLPNCRALLLRKHTVELERVMRLLRALVQQMKGQVSRIEEALAETWQLHRHEAVARPSDSVPGPDGTPQSGNAIVESPGVGGGRGKATKETAAIPVGGEPAVGPAEHLQWLGDMSSMLIHEQWRKEVLLSKINFGPDAPSQRARAHALTQWSSRSNESLLDRTLMDNALDAAQVVPLPKSR